MPQVCLQFVIVFFPDHTHFFVFMCTFRFVCMNSNVFPQCGKGWNVIFDFGIY